MSKKFVDRLRIFVSAGSGAAGNPAIRGKGGDGGSVYLEVKEGYSLGRLVQDNPSKRFKVCDFVFTCVISSSQLAFVFLECREIYLHSVQLISEHAFS
ncbi:unnamed protein product [Echinostoma caproni]|uniref:Obg domain-containing protein n=1 Tax=Echinostoma caproni TaxID=27848 RepID=A0A183A4P4_9TREM|nr:unnamed protein product [Echinostoma caproni]